MTFLTPHDSTVSADALAPFASESALRKAMLDAAGTIAAEGLDRLGMFSLSHRAPRSAADGMLHLGGTSATAAVPADLPWLALDPGQGAPASGGTGWQGLHRRLLQTLPTAHCVLTLAPIHTTALACLPEIHRDGLPPFHPALAAFGADDLACAGFVMPVRDDAPDDALESVLTALGSRHACLLASQGALITATSLPQAMTLARLLEALARTYCVALQIGEPAALGAGPMHESRRQWQAPAGDPDGSV